MTTERRPQEAIDERFWAVVADAWADPAAHPCDAGHRRRGDQRLLSVALAAGVVALFIAVVLFRLHLVAGVVWLYVGAPALVLASVCPADRALERGRLRASPTRRGDPR
jgi:Flp pilus assembly protein TadB